MHAPHPVVLAPFSMTTAMVSPMTAMVVISKRMYWECQNSGDCECQGEIAEHRIHPCKWVYPQMGLRRSSTAM
jgi:hypothetical protein